MKIGFIGNMANNMYLMAGAFRVMGNEAHYYHIPSDFMFSQPFWEDLDLLVPYEQLWDTAAVARLRQAWVKPPWVSEKPYPCGGGRLGRHAGCHPLAFPSASAQYQGLAGIGR